jgi:hypothetical protein
MTRRLGIRRETLAELSTDELGAVVGGVPPTLNVQECLPSGHTCLDCITRYGCV